MVELKGSYNSMERPSTISEHLNIVEVKCDVVDEKIIKIMKLLCAILNIGEQTNDTFHALYVPKIIFMPGKESK